MYNVDQWKIMKQLAGSLPKRETLKIGEIKDKCFKSAPNDRVVRNAIRKPVKEGHVEIAERGDYRLTQKGVSFFQKMEKEGFKPSAVRQMAKPAKKERKVAPKKAPKPAKAAKPVKKAAAKKVAKKVAKPTNGKTETKAAAPAAPAEPKKSAAKIPHPKKDTPAAEPKTNGEAKATEGSSLTF